MIEKSNRNFYQDFLSNIRKRLFSRDALVFLMFLVLAGIFWFVQSFDRQKDAMLRIPIDYIGVPNDIEIESKLPKQITIKVRDQGMFLLKYYRRKTVPLALDLNRSYFGKGKFVITTDQLKNRLTSYVLPSTSILSVEPDSILVEYHQLSSKKLPVKINAAISLAPQYIQSGELLIEPSIVKVFGAKNILDTMTAVYTEKIYFKSVSDTTVIKAPLERIKGVKYPFDDVNVTLKVEMFTEKKIQLPIVIINNPPDVNVRIFPPSANVTYNVALSNFTRVKDSDIRLVFDYKEAIEQKRRRYKLIPVVNSSYVFNVRTAPEEVEFIIEEK